MPRSITVTVSPTGETRIETTGFTGAECQQATRRLEAALGVREHEQLTSAFYTAVPATVPAQHTAHFPSS
jgi:hypothetical protein